MAIMHLIKGIVFGLLGASLVFPVLAHHSTAVNYNRESIITVEGIVTRFKFQNPHVQIFFDVITDAGEVEHWLAEMSAKNQLVRNGWSGDEFQIGEDVRITGSEGYRPRSMLLSSAIKGDGTELSAGPILGR